VHGSALLVLEALLHHGGELLVPVRHRGMLLSGVAVGGESSPASRVRCALVECHQPEVPSRLQVQA
jgi:hypothetical protein